MKRIHEPKIDPVLSALSVFPVIQNNKIAVIVEVKESLHQFLHDEGNMKGLMEGFTADSSEAT